MLSERRPYSRLLAQDLPDMDMWHSGHVPAPTDTEPPYTAWEITPVVEQHLRAVRERLGKPLLPQTVEIQPIPEA